MGLVFGIALGSFDAMQPPTPHPLQPEPPGVPLKIQFRQVYRATALKSRSYMRQFALISCTLICLLAVYCLF
jgi:hypothetical protein